jgi:hypothetical protein
MFKGKVVLLYLTNPPEDFTGGVAIVNPEIFEVENRRFVVGTAPERPYDWTSGLRASVAFDQIAYFLEFADESEFLAKTLGEMSRSKAGGN